MRRLILIIAFVMMLVSPSWGAVLFSENFDSQADWTMQQYLVDGYHCWTGLDCTPGSPPTNWTGYYNGQSYCASVSNNSIYIDQYAGFPEETNTCRGGAGKCVTFWDESCTTSFVNSDGALFLDLGSDYQTIYVRFYIRFESDYTWAAASGGNEYPQHKYWESTCHKFRHSG
jgi:hypothetical protein